MASTREGSVHLFRFAGVDVFLHWSWFVVAIIEIQSRSGRYTSIAWNVAEYLALFLIVTLHEFGLAGKSEASRIRLCCGLWAESPMSILLRGLARLCGVLRRDR